jgi:hypothetical protein
MGACCPDEFGLDDELFGELPAQVFLGHVYSSLLPPYGEWSA